MATNEELSEAISDAAETAADRGVKRYKIRNREVENYSLKDLVDAKLKLDALSSSRRGFTVARITRPT